MQVVIKEFNVEMVVRNKGLELDISDTSGRHLGDLVLTKTSVVWCKGKTTPDKGKKLTWAKFISVMEAL